MIEAATTWALVVGIDAYEAPAIRTLTGAVNDAVAAVAWLRMLGVPDSQLLLHAAPSDASRPGLEALGLVYADARKPTVWGSIARLRRVAGGTRLIVVLTGHGLFEPAGGRLFLTQEAGVDDLYVNLGLDTFIQVFLALPFRRQFLFMDGCLNYPYATGVRPTIQPAGPDGAPLPVPDPANGLVALYSASQGQVAREGGNRGLFMDCLLEALDPARLSAPPRGLCGAVSYDFTTGARSVDLRRVMDDWVRPALATVAPNQTPGFDLSGAAQGRPSFPLYRLLPDLPAATVQVEVQPPDAVASLTGFDLYLDDRARPWEERLARPPLPAIPVPLVRRLPLGAPAVVECSVEPTAPWDIVNASQHFTVGGDQRVLFELQPRVTVGAGDTGTERYNVGLRTADGARAYEVRYDSRLAAAVTRAVAAAAVEVPLLREAGGGQVRGIGFEHHESGPVFHVPRDLETAGRALVAAWAEAVREVAPAGLAVETVVRGDQASPALPNLRFTLPENGLEPLVGALADRLAVSAGPATATKGDETAARRLPLRALEHEPTVWLPPGPTRLQLETPWGSWTAVEIVPASGQLTVALPATIGHPPLRVRLHAERARRDGQILGVADRARAASGRPFGSPRRRRTLQPGQAGRAAWALAWPGASAPAAWLATLAGPTPVVFPVDAGRTLAIEWIGAWPRVEPLAAVAEPAWDLLLVVGQLDGLTPDAAWDLAMAKWEDPLLGLAGAYALFAAADWSRLRVVAGNLRGLPLAGPDLDLLALAAESPGATPLPAAAVERLAALAAAAEPPRLRWGVRLGCDLLARAGRGPGLTSWRRSLQAIEAGLSPVSVWTAWVGVP